MQINGPVRIDRAQSISQPHQATAASTPQPAVATADELDLSQETDLVGRVHQLPDIRADRVAQIRAEIASGAYETEDKLDIALERLMDEWC
ncbi:MAG: flagellar biosynthesis anti-sigma factor FlgM [Planctomycetales bacterium]|nr:flagellar biosynthesis anti-sigma factor FlgM [Planctomycetales bacterium]